MPAEALGPSPDLCAAINAWAFAYDDHGRNADRWPGDDDYATEGERLAALASAELGRTVVYDGQVPTSAVTRRSAAVRRRDAAEHGYVRPALDEDRLWAPIGDNNGDPSEAGRHRLHLALPRLPPEETLAFQDRLAECV